MTLKVIKIIFIIKIEEKKINYFNNNNANDVNYMSLFLANNDNVFCMQFL